MNLNNITTGDIVFLAIIAAVILVIAKMMDRLLTVIIVIGVLILLGITTPVDVFSMLISIKDWVVNFANGARNTVNSAM